MPVIITLSVVGAILALVAIILLLNVSLIIQYDESVTLKLRVLFITVTLYPEKKQSSNPWYNRIITHTRRFFSTPRSGAKKSQTESGGKRKTSASNVIDIVRTVYVIVKELLSKFSKHLKIKIARIHIRLATGDAAHTAIAYGALTQSINVLFPLLEDIKNFSLPKNKNIDISPDFLSEESEIELRLVFSLRVWQLLVTAAGTVYKLIIHYIKSLERKETKNHGN